MLLLCGIQKLRLEKRDILRSSMKFFFLIVLIKYVAYNNYKYINITFQINVYNEILETNYTLNPNNEKNTKKCIARESDPDPHLGKVKFYH